MNCSCLFQLEYRFEIQYFMDSFMHALKLPNITLHKTGQNGTSLSKYSGHKHAEKSLHYKWGVSMDKSSSFTKIIKLEKLILEKIFKVKTCGLFMYSQIEQFIIKRKKNLLHMTSVEMKCYLGSFHNFTDCHIFMIYSSF